MPSDPVADLVAALRPRRAGALIALDFDGTLAEIVPDPADARPVPGARDALIALAGQGVRLAVITGRDAATVLALGDVAGVPGLTVAGLYGAETWVDGRLRTVPTPDGMAGLRRRLDALLGDADVDPGVWIEDKRLSLVVHARPATDPAEALAHLREPVTALATEAGLQVHPGRDVLELRMAGYDKGTALRAVAASGPAPTAVLVAGDDTGDRPAFAQARTWRAAGTPAWSVAVHNRDLPEVADDADVLVADPAELVRLLAAVAR